MIKRRIRVILLSIVLALLLGFIYALKHRHYIRNSVELYLAIYNSLNENYARNLVNVKLPIKIMHAGGSINKMTYTNSLEALNQSYKKGFRFFELDFDMTTDSIPVCIHGWEQSILFEGGIAGVPLKFYDFVRAQRKDSLTSLTIDSLIDWLNKHPNTFIVTDVKSDNIKVLEIIANRYPSMVERFIPQIYSFNQYKPARLMGFQNIILTLYRSSYSDEIVSQFSQNFKLYAITMWSKRAMNTPLVEMLSKSNTPVFAHTVNDSFEFEKLKMKGVVGVYTDSLWH